MEKRPDSPMQQSPAPPDDDQQHVVHHTSQRKKRKKGVGGEQMELSLTSMIDVIFQLLIYFVITANFMIDEGTIIATLPGNAATDGPPPPPSVDIPVEIRSSNDGITYTLLVDNRPMENVTELYGYLSTRKKDQPVQLIPQGNVRWQHVVNVFNTCIRAEMENVSFLQPTAS